MAFLKTYNKHPAEKLSFDIPFTKALALPEGQGGLEGDTIASITFLDCSAGVAVVEQEIIQPDIVRVWVIGGINGRYYTVAADITSANGRIKHGEIRLRVRGAGIPIPLPIDAGSVGDQRNLTPIDGGEF